MSTTANRWLREPSATKISFALLSIANPIAPPKLSMLLLLAGSAGAPPRPPRPPRPPPRPAAPRPGETPAYAVSPPLRPAAATGGGAAGEVPYCAMNLPSFENLRILESAPPAPPIQKLPASSIARPAFCSGQLYPSPGPPQWATSAPLGSNSSTFGAEAQHSP